MGTILLERQCVERLSVWSRDPWKKSEAPWSSSRPDAARIKMGRRQSQRKPLQPPPCSPADQENNHNRKLQHRRQKSSTSSNQSGSPVTTDSKSHPPSLPVADRTSKQDSKVQQVPQRRRRMSTRQCRHTAAFPCHQLSDSSPDLLERQFDNPEKRTPNVAADSDSDTDLSDSERFSTLPCGGDPPRLDLQPEIYEVLECSSRCGKPRPGHCGFEFPDFLPPPFNSWSLSQLAVFYNMEGTGAPRPRPVGALERYMEKLLQLEWHQIQTVQEETGKSAITSAHSCLRSPAAVSSRLSTPKCILHCQRAFPLSFLSSLANHTALLSGCACTQCRIRYTNTCGTSCCRSSFSRQSRLSPVRSAQGSQFLPKRSYSESRVHASGRALTCTSPRLSSPVRTTNHLKRMQASGNMRNQGAHINSESTVCDPRIRSGQLDTHRAYKTGGSSRRSGSEHRKRESDKFSEKRRSKSECRRSGVNHRVKLKNDDIKPDAVTAIMDNLPVSKYSIANRTNRPKQVEFVT